MFLMQKIVCFGDSITAGWNGVQETRALTDRLERGLNCRVVNAGIPGETTRQARSRIEELIDDRANWIIILFGSNDASYHKGIPADEFRGNLIAFIQSFHPYRVILVTPPPVIDEKQIGKRENKHIVQYAAIVRDLANAMSLPLIDLYKIMNGRKDLINLLLDDGLHFSHDGYDLFAQHIIERINCLEENKKKA
ncbi:hypothetical protein P343_02450 [Sporolactobacillus laevolacticus DSM 442]|uniref:SGNH hydrolase-type esterase domain-containing protein n=2 Tax=Sporolactobacillus laevolacticus TaxID=33018 RepID=V6J1F6_9BACL|nr:hypothetical protein P343_02450 [Sporolactobacillus laevolacticus DSM 442]